MDRSEHRLAYDERGYIHVMNRTLALCKARTTHPVGTATATGSEMARVLTRHDMGCMDCATALVGNRLKKVRYEV